MKQFDQQIEQTLSLLHDVYTHDLLGVYLFGSAISGGLQKYSDIDIFVVIKRTTRSNEKNQLVAGLLEISGLYMKDVKYPLELTIVVQSQINPWHYQPPFDFQYGEWLRDDFEKGNITPWPSKDMPDLALLITQVLLSSKLLFGLPPGKILPPIPYNDCVKAMAAALPELMANLESDTRNVLLTLARTWLTLETDTIYSKPEAAIQVIPRLPKEHQLVLGRARAICLGEEAEYWDDMKNAILPCATFMRDKISECINMAKRSGKNDKTIKMA